jgi:hypothetical protein
MSASNWLESTLEEDGSVRGAPVDLAYYYKAPWVFAATGKPYLAALVGDYVRLSSRLDSWQISTVPSGPREPPAPICATNIVASGNLFICEIEYRRDWIGADPGRYTKPRERVHDGKDASFVRDPLWGPGIYLWSR